MPFMIGIGEPLSPILTIAPIILLMFSGYSVGRIISKVFNTDLTFVKALIYGNVILNLLFISGIIIFGLLVHFINGYFTFFTYLLVALSILGIHFVFEKLIRSILSRTVGEYLSGKIKNAKAALIFWGRDGQTNIFILFAASLFVTILAYQFVIIYFHPIYSEYDSIYLYLPVSKSILLGNGLEHDFYLGSDVNMRFAPFVQSINAWLLHSFEYSSIRMFPIYYVFFATILVYSLARNILIKTSSKGDASFFGLIASSAFLITPAILVTSSRFSLQQDLAFVLFLTASFYFLSEIVRYDKPTKIKLLGLSASLALMMLTREVGLVMSIAIFFLVPAIKYTEGNLKLRFLFTVLSLLPFYVFYLIFYSPFSPNFGLIIIVIANLAIFYIVSKLKIQNNFSFLIGSAPNLINIIPLIIPMIFIGTNIVVFNGLYPSVSFSNKFYETVGLQMDALTQISRPPELLDTIMGVPRLDILFISIATAGIFIIFKLVGLGKAIYRLKNNYEYSLIIILLILLLITWSSVLDSGFQISNIRHVTYFVPLLSIVLVIGLKKNEESPLYWKLFCFAIIVISTFYFLTFNLHSLLYSKSFAGFEIDPFKSPIITTTDIGLGITLAMPVLVVGLLKLIKYPQTKKEFKLSRYHTIIIIISLVGLLALQINTLSLVQVSFNSSEVLDTRIEPGWEFHVSEVIHYLNKSENGNVLAFRASGIPFFTNRTNFDLSNQQTFAYAISDLVSIKNSTHLKQRLSDMAVKYIILPNEHSSLYYSAQNLLKKSQFLQTINTDDAFEKITFKEFNIYKFNPTGINTIDLIDENHVWKSFGKTTEVHQNKNNLTIHVEISKNEKTYNRATLQTVLNLTNKPLIMSLDYKVRSIIGNATYVLEIRDNNSKILFESTLNDLSGNSTNQTLLLPKDIVGKALEFRLYVITQGISNQTIVVGKFSMFYA